jgi:tetratricopeptide (TPR) repeat protein
MHLNRILARHGDKAAVQRLVDRLAAPYDSVPEAHFAMGQAAANTGDFMRAQSEFEKALLLRPDWEAAALSRAQLQARQSNKSAIASLSEFTEHYPNARDARLALARLLINDKQYSAARTQFDRLIKDNPDSPEVIYPVAMLALQQGDATTGRTQLEKLLKSDFQDKSTVHFFLAQIDEDQKKPEAALEHYRQVTVGDQYITARSRAAQILVKQGKAEEARDLIRSTQAGSVAEKTQLILAESQLLREAGRHNDAYAVLDSALAKQPDNPELLYETALTRRTHRQARGSGKPPQAPARLKPDHAHALNALGYSLAERNIRLDEASDLITKALLLAPEDPFIMDSMGWVLFRQGKLPEALRTLERAYQIKADPEIAAHLGEVLWTMDRKDDARRILKEAAKKPTRTTKSSPAPSRNSCLELRFPCPAARRRPADRLRQPLPPATLPPRDQIRDFFAGPPASPCASPCRAQQTQSSGGRLTWTHQNQQRPRAARQPARLRSGRNRNDARSSPACVPPRARLAGIRRPRCPDRRSHRPAPAGHPPAGLAARPRRRRSKSTDPFGRPQAARSRLAGRLQLRRRRAACPAGPPDHLAQRRNRTETAHRGMEGNAVSEWNWDSTWPAPAKLNLFPARRRPPRRWLPPAANRLPLHRPRRHAALRTARATARSSSPPPFPASRPTAT